MSNTNLPSQLFHAIEKSIEISRFVRDNIDVLAPQTLNHLIWHFDHPHGEFASYLSQEICELSENVDSEAAIKSMLRRCRRCHSVAIAVLELNNLMSVEESSARMSILAELLTKAAYCWVLDSFVSHYGRPAGEQNLLILAMGKMGGGELNFSSDIDLIFFYPTEGETTGGRRCIEHGRFFQKVGALVIKLLDEVTEDGFVFRVDMRLRPYGDSGALAMSLEQAEHYYQDQGREWERFAMLRARVITGNEQEQNQLRAIIRPFVYRRYIDYGVFDSLRNMKEMIQREVRRQGLNNNIKLGAGGIREIEFMVQSLQLIQGGRDKRLRERQILKVIPLLLEDKLLSSDMASDLSHAYRFLRRIENNIQALNEKQTQELPNEPAARDVLAKINGFNSWLLLADEIKKIQLQIHDYFTAVFGEDRRKILEQDEFYLSLWEGHISINELNKRFSSISVEELMQAVDKINAMRLSPAVQSLSARGAKRLVSFMPTLLSLALKQNNPSCTLMNLFLVLQAILTRTAYLELLSENPPLLEHLVNLTSRSHWITERLSHYPILLDELLYPKSLYKPLALTDLNAELTQNILRIDENDEERLLDTIRIFKQTNELRIASALMSEQFTMRQASHYLTQLAEVVIESALGFCWRQLTEKHGEPAKRQTNKGFMVIGYGKLGGGELGFGSDLDLVFLYDGDAQESTSGKKPLVLTRFYTRLAQKLIHFLSTRTSLGLLYEVDMRLRPSGNSGLLVSHIDAFSEYQRNSAWTWEHQALIRARPISKDKKLEKTFLEIRNKVLLAERDTNRIRTEVLEMRTKMRKQLLDETSQVSQVKQGVGGLVDIEFIAQYLTLVSVKDETCARDIPFSTINCLKEVKSEVVTTVQVKQLIACYRNYSDYLNARVLDPSLNESQYAIEENRKVVADIWDQLFTKI